MKPTTRIFAALGLILALLLNGQAHAVSYIHIDNAGAVNSYPSLADLSADTNSVFLGPGEVNGAFGNDPGFFYDSASGGYIHIDNAGAVNSYPSLPDLAADTNSVFLGPGEVNGAFGDDPGFFHDPVSGGYIHIDNAGAVNSYPSLPDLAADTNSVFLGPGEINGAFGNDPGFFFDPISGGYIHIDNAGAVNSYPSLADLAADTNSVFLGPGEVNGAFGDDPGFFATPEPSSFVLAALGLIGLVVWRRRRCLAERC